MKKFNVIVTTIVAGALVAGSSLATDDSPQRNLFDTVYKARKREGKSINYSIAYATAILEGKPEECAQIYAEVFEQAIKRGADLPEADEMASRAVKEREAAGPPVNKRHCFERQY